MKKIIHLFNFIMMSLIFIGTHSALFPLISFESREYLGEKNLDSLIFWGSRVYVVFCHYFVGKTSIKVLPEQSSKTLIAMIMMVVTGVGLRVFIEYGETSFMSDFTAYNVILHISVTSLMMYFGQVAEKRNLKRENQSC
jgi:uncharacterized protein YacL